MSKVVESVEHSFRKFFVYPVLKRVFRNDVWEQKIDLATVQRVLIFRYDRIGDLIVTTPIFQILKSRNPRLHLTLLVSSANAELVRSNRFIDEVVELPSNWIKLFALVLRLRRQHFDVVLNFIFNRTTGPGILANLIAPKGLKIGQGPDRYAFYFNRLLKLPRFEEHMIRSLVYCVEEVFDIRVTNAELKFHIPVDDETNRLIDAFLDQHQFSRQSRKLQGRRPYVLFNLSAKDRERRISSRQAAALAEHLSRREDIATVYLCAPEDAEMNGAVNRESSFSGSVLYETAETHPLTQIASLVAGAVLVITPDTSIIHFASAMGTPVLGLYTSLQGMEEWLPHNIRYRVIKAPEGKPASAIEPADIIRAADEFLASLLGPNRQLASSEV